MVCYIMIAAQLRTMNVYTDNCNLLSRVILWFFTKLKKPGPFRSILDAARIQTGLAGCFFSCTAIALDILQMLQLYSDHAGHFANRRDIYQLAKVVHGNRSSKSL